MSVNVSGSESWTLCCEGVCQSQSGGVRYDCCPVSDDGCDESVKGCGREAGEGSDVPCANRAMTVPLSL